MPAFPQRCYFWMSACGPGYVSAAAKKVGAVPTGIDFSEKMVAIPRRRFPEIGFRQGDAKDLPFEDGSFDRVLMNFGLLHVSQQRAASRRTLSSDLINESLMERDSKRTKAG